MSKDLALKSKNLSRLRFIEAMLALHGEVRRCHLQRAFGFGSASPASNVLSEFRALFPEAMVLDGKTKTWLACAGFVPVLLTVEPQEYLHAAQVMAVEQIVKTKPVILMY
ncbi:hypothetical protein [Aeromonas salmonicida]|uniref:hypothetical protein n=1 Tax=Aeromonas salmonicida TaxID=645 RepID=UPI00232A9AFD|nr:hypothetical protein [Aeromonas salmonicida]WCH25213.1 hypothetical protein ONZ54_22835 [Aeromonas salmonicida]